MMMLDVEQERKREYKRRESDGNTGANPHIWDQYSDPLANISGPIMNSRVKMMKNASQYIGLGYV